MDADTSKSILLPIKILDPDQLGALSITVSTTKPHYLLELINSKGSVIKTLKNPNTYIFKNLAPEEYKIRIIEDDNNNGKWDVGNFENGVTRGCNFV